MNIQTKRDLVRPTQMQVSQPTIQTPTSSRK